VPKSFVMFEMLNPMLLVAQEAKRRGMQIVVLNNSPLQHAGPFAVPDGFVDELIHVESWSDTAAVEKLVLDVRDRHDVAGTYAGFEPALPYDAQLRELVGLPNNGAENLRSVLDKNSLRGRLREAGLTELGSTTLDQALTWTEWPFPGRAVLKPANGTGSACVFMVSSLDELRAAVAEIEKVEIANPLMRDYIAGSGVYVLEAEARGELLSVESLVCRGEVHSIGLMGRYVLAKDPVVEMGFQFPYRHPRMQEVFALAKEFHRVLGFQNGATQIEVMVPEEGTIELIDFNPRLGGTGKMVVFGQAYGVEYQTYLADLGCGLTPDLDFPDHPVRYVGEHLLLPQPGVTRFDSIEFPEGTFCHRLPRPVGSELSGRADQLDCVAFMLISAESASAVQRVGLAARRDTEVNGVPLGDNENNILAASPYIGVDLP